MKKLMIAAAIVCAAAFTQAATVAWTLNSGTLKGAENKNGGWGDTVLNVAGTVSAYLFIVDSTAYGAFDSATAWDGFTANGSSSKLKIGDTTFTVDKTASNLATGTASLKGSKTDYAAGDDAYAVVIYTYTDSTYGDMYIANAAEVHFATASSKTTNNMALYEGGGTTGTVMGWTAVPEPTSGLLMLIGMAGLALRRRRA